MKRTYYLVEGFDRTFSTLKAIRLWLYSLDMQERFEYDMYKIYYCIIPFSQSYPMKVIHVHPVTGEVWFSKVV